jgi:NitT/TauT family transport system ATP-binding protein
LLQLRNVKKEFIDKSGKKLPVIDNVTISIRQGEFVSFLGPSGCGKTTLINIIAGLVTTSSGTVLVNGKTINSPGLDRAVVFQDSCLLPWLTVRENVGMALNSDNSGKEKICDYYIDMVKLNRFKSAYPHQLSGGMKQRVALARALATDSPVLLMDEPFSALDEQTRMLLQNELMQIWQRTNKTIVFVTHNIREAIFLSDRVLLLSHHPAKIISEIAIPDIRPRVGGEHFFNMEAEILLHLKREIEKATEEELGERYIL